MGDAAGLVAAVLRWYAGQARDLPWRRPDRTPWGVLVSEVMLQQTPVARVEPAWRAWMLRWPTPAALAADAPGEAIRMWGRLGYPRRALRLHAAAVAIVERHGGIVPTDIAELRALPGVGEYTAAAVASFAHGRRHAVLDTNVRRVLARAVSGVAAPGAAITRAERRLAEGLLPPDDATAATWAVASMELGALVCTARAPRCEACPIAARCSWFAAGRPGAGTPVGRAQAWHGTDRQVRGRLLRVVRDADGPVPLRALRDAVPPEELRDVHQRERCLDGLVADGLLVPLAGERFALP